MPQDKQTIRKWVWDQLTDEKQGAFPFPLHGRIPNFKGARDAAIKIRDLVAFRQASVIKINPDSPQKPVREAVLAAGKTLVMPSPRLREGFYVVENASRKAKEASQKKKVPEYGVLTPLHEMPTIDLVITGAVAVDEQGGRIGKGHGYGELEYAIGRELELIDKHTPVITSVHPLQVVSEIPQDRHDVPMDYIATPESLIKTNNPRPKPEGIFWESITPEMQEAMPVLQDLANFKP